MGSSPLFLFLQDYNLGGNCKKNKKTKKNAGVFPHRYFLKLVESHLLRNALRNAHDQWDFCLPTDTTFHIPVQLWWFQSQKRKKNHQPIIPNRWFQSLLDGKTSQMGWKNIGNLNRFQTPQSGGRPPKPPALRRRRPAVARRSPRHRNWQFWGRLFWVDFWVQLR